MGYVFVEVGGTRLSSFEIPLSFVLSMKRVPFHKLVFSPTLSTHYIIIPSYYMHVCVCVCVCVGCLVSRQQLVHMHSWFCIYTMYA